MNELDKLREHTEEALHRADDREALQRAEVREARLAMAERALLMAKEWKRFAEGQVGGMGYLPITVNGQPFVPMTVGEDELHGMTAIMQQWRTLAGQVTAERDALGERVAYLKRWLRECTAERADLLLRVAELEETISRMRKPISHTVRPCLVIEDDADVTEQARSKRDDKEWGYVSVQEDQG